MWGRVGIADSFDADMPPEAAHWAQLAAERDLPKAAAAHAARMPGDLLAEAPVPTATFALCEPWGDLADWTPITSADQLNALVPPAEA